MKFYRNVNILRRLLHLQDKHGKLSKDLPALREKEECA